jgi:multidrug efflux pump subunit AcrA (membrane-fusion protein)
MKEENLSELEIRSEEVRDIISHMPTGLIRYGNLLLLGLVLTFIAGLYLIKYPDTITSDITITTRLPPVRIVANTTWKLLHLLVKNNELVPQGCVIGVIESSADYRAIEAVKKAIQTPGEDRLLELKGLQLGDIEPSYTQWEDALKDFYMQRRLTPELREREAIRKQIAEYKLLIQKKQVQAKIYQEELEIYQNDYLRNKSLFEQKIIALKDFEEKKKEFLLAKRNHESIKIEVANSQIILNDLEKSLLLLVIKQDKTTFGLDRQLQDKLRALEVAIMRWEQAYLLKASLAGRVSYLQFLTANQNIKQGDEICSIIPHETNDLLGRVLMPIRNSGKVKVGQPVNICLENYPCAEWGSLKGRITAVSLVPQNGKYTIEIELLEGLKTTYHKNLEFKQEMAGTAKIVADDLRLLERIFREFHDALNQ